VRDGRRDGASGSSHWYWGYANYPDGLFSTFSDGALWRFQDMATGERRMYVTAWDKPPAGLGDRFTMNVAWYLNGSWTKTLQVAVPWQNGDSGNLWCRQSG